nr:hypothetical protein [uncultured Allomuricauda sp.]
MKIENPILMSTYNTIESQEEWQDSSPFDYDALSWIDNILIGSENLPSGITYMIITKRLKKELEDFQITFS